jgi:hypothetical protein
MNLVRKVLVRKERVRKVRVRKVRVRKIPGAQSTGAQSTVNNPCTSRPIQNRIPFGKTVAGKGVRVPIRPIVYRSFYRFTADEKRRCLPSTVFRSANGERKTGGATIAFRSPSFVSSTVYGTWLRKNEKIATLVFRLQAFFVPACFKR